MNLFSYCLSCFYFSSEIWEWCTVTKVCELWKRNLRAITLSSVSHQILSTFSSSVFPRPHPSILSSSTASVSLFTSAAAISCWCLERRSMVRLCLFALFTENFCLVPSAQIKPVSLSLFLRRSQHSCQEIFGWKQQKAENCTSVRADAFMFADMTVSDQIHRIFLCIMTIFVLEKFNGYISLKSNSQCAFTAVCLSVLYDHK